MTAIKSRVWGNDLEDVTQGFGVFNQSTAYMYDYAPSVGYPAGTHVGIDIGVPKGTDIFAAEPGEVIQAGFSEFFRPKPVWVKEDDGDTAIYGHLWTNNVNVGDKVEAGQKLGTSGEQTEKGTMTPDKTGPHLHFELRDSSGKAIDPVPELTGSTGATFGGSSGFSKWLLFGGIGALGLALIMVVRK